MYLIFKLSIVRTTLGGVRTRFMLFEHASKRRRERKRPRKLKDIRALVDYVRVLIKILGSLYYPLLRSNKRYVAINFELWIDDSWKDLSNFEGPKPAYIYRRYGPTIYISLHYMCLSRKLHSKPLYYRPHI